MVPVSQSILVDTFPPAKRGQAFALFGVAVVVAPVVGPTLGGWLSDNVSWHWCFLINGPVGLLDDRGDRAAAARDAGAGRGTAEAAADRRRLRPRGLRPGRHLPGRARDHVRPRPRGRLVRLGLHRRGRRHLRPRLRPDDPVGDDPAQSDDRHPHGGDTAVRRLLPRDAGDRRHPARDHAVPAAARAAGSRLHRHLGRPRPVARRPRDHGDDVRHRPPADQDPAQIPDRRRRLDHRALDVQSDVDLRRRRLLVPRPVAHAAGRRLAADLPVDHRRLLRRHIAATRSTRRRH